MRRVVEAAWDDLTALAFRYGHSLPAPLVARSRELLERAQRPRLAETWLSGDGLVVRHRGNDPFLRADLAGRLNAAPAAPSTVPDLSLTEVARRTGRRWREAGCLIAPQLIVASVDLDIPEQVLWDRERRRLAAHIERDLGCEVDGLGAFDDFYDRMYEPTARARFSGSGYVARRRYLRRLTSAGEICFATREGRRIAGALVVAVRGRPYERDVRVWGALDGERGDATAARAFEALFVFAIRGARQRGERRLGLGLGYPFATDGGLRFKKRWGATIQRDLHDSRCLAVQARSDAGVRALARLGLIFEAGGSLEAIGDARSANRTTPGIARVHQPSCLEELRRLAREGAR